MKYTTLATGLLLAATTTYAQNITIPATDGSIPAPGPNGCAAGYYPGSNTITYTVPYTYQQVLSVIGNYTNLTWSGSPPGSVKTNNTDALYTNNWTPGSARFYSIAGAYIIETITTYSKPANGPYIEVHTVAPLTIPAADVTFYSSYDAQDWYPICNGMATRTNFTITFCATNVTTAGPVLGMLHMTDAATVGQFLGGQNFTSCAALGASGNGTSGYNATATSGVGPVATYTGAAAAVSGVGSQSGFAAVVAIAAWLTL